MATRKTSGMTEEERWKANRGPEPGPYGVPTTGSGPHERLEMMHAEKVPLTPTDVRVVLGGSGEELVELEPCADRQHRWYRGAGQDWMAPITALAVHPELVPSGARVVVTTIDGNNGHRVYYRVARPGDRKAHEAELEATRYAAEHPRQGPHVYVPDVPLHPDTARLIDIDDVLGHFELFGMRLVRVGDRVTLATPARGGHALPSGEMNRAPGDPDRDLLERWSPLIVASLGGPKVTCALDGCSRPAQVMLAGRVAICRPDYDAGIDGPKPATRPAIGRVAAALASVLPA